MQKHFYAMMSRMKNIYRWGLMRNTRQENLSEHSLEVAQIAHALARINRNRFAGNADPNFVAVSAMYHDTSEIITGDLPTPVKYYNDDIRKAYQQIEAISEQSLLSMLPDDLKEEYVPLISSEHSDKELVPYVKAADKLSALIKCICEIRMGNREFIKAERTIRESLESTDLVALKVFMEEFLPAYDLTLDELD